MEVMGKERLCITKEEIHRKNEKKIGIWNYLVGYGKNKMMFAIMRRKGIQMLVI